uniref:Putative secreted protein n=1 Tax=Anopheles darlingi TaxID=43151 RepID=A0A2M4D223_ANODA
MIWKRVEELVLVLAMPVATFAVRHRTPMPPRTVVTKMSQRQRSTNTRTRSGIGNTRSVRRRRSISVKRARSRRWRSFLRPLVAKLVLTKEAIRKLPKDHRVS